MVVKSRAIQENHQSTRVRQTGVGATDCRSFCSPRRTGSNIQISSIKRFKKSGFYQKPFQMSSKDNEVKLLHKDINSLRTEYEKLVEIKQALAMEITIYRNIIEGEEKRIRKYVNLVIFKRFQIF